MLDVRQLQWEQKYLLLKRFQEREGHCNVTQSHKEDGANLGRWVANQRQAKKTGTLESYRGKRLEEIGIEWVRHEKRGDVPWDEMYALLKQFQKREGHCNVTCSHTEDGANLGAWVSHHRQIKRKETLDIDREKRLEEIGFEWATSATWDKMYALLKQYKMREGHCSVPRSHVEAGSNLGTWASRQRQRKTKEKLDPDRQKRLEKIGFELVASASWDEMHALLEQFEKREEHCNAPQSHKEDGSNLGTWVSHQRHLKRKGKLDPGRQKRLEKIGFEWMTSATWDEMYALLLQFKRREGHCNAPRSHTEDGSNLGTWGHDQRQLNRKEKLDSDRQTRLEEIGFEWVLPSAAWDKMVALLKQFMIREGHCNVSTSHKEDGSNLGTWVSTQRRLEKTGKLDPDRQKRLDDFGFKWVRQAKAP
jgi:intein-encoded DNA endonuclease-like protein